MMLKHVCLTKVMMMMVMTMTCMATHTTMRTMMGRLWHRQTRGQVLLRRQTRGQVLTRSPAMRLLISPL